MQSNNGVNGGNGVNISNFPTQSEGFDFKYLVAKVVGNWKWFALSLIVCLGIGVLYVMYAIPSFTIAARVLVNGQNANKIQSGVTETDILHELGLFSQSADVNNELQIIHSRTLIERAVRDLQLNVSYWGQGDIRFAEVYKRSPFFIDLLDLKTGLDYPLTWDVRIDGDKVKFIDNYTNQRFTMTWGDTAKLKYCTFVLQKNPDVTLHDPTLPLGLKIASYNGTYAAYNSNLLTFLSGTLTTCIDLSLDASVPQKGEDFVNHLIGLYIQNKIDGNNGVADSTIKFIDERISGVARELSNVEQNIQIFKTSEGITDIQEQSKALIGQNSDAAKALATQEAQIQWVGDLENYLEDDQNNQRTMPTTAPISDQAYISLVERYNNLQQQRQSLLLNSTENNPQVQGVDVQLHQIRSNLVRTLKTYKEGLIVNKDNLQKQTSTVQTAIQRMPVQQRQFLEASRRQDVLQQLYVYLLTVREQTAVTKSNNIAPVRIIDFAKASVLPYWPNMTIVLIAAIFIGLVIPSTVILINELINNKVTTPSDIVGATATPIIAEINHSRLNQPVVVTKDSRTVVAEQFRTLRTNLLFRLAGTNDKVIMCTSTVSGEGKSFVTLNVACALALSGKQVLLVDMELRKAQLSADIGLDNTPGIGEYLEKNISLTEVIQPSGINGNLWFLSCGELVSNPSETLINDKMEDMFLEMRNRFDYVIVDTPPAAIVTDAQVVGRYCDLTLYVVRQLFTYKKHVDVIEDLRANDKLKNMYIILNDVKLVPGYNQGYGSGYRFDEDLGYYHKEEVKEKKSLLQRIFPES